MTAVLLFLLLPVRVERCFAVFRRRKNREPMNRISHTRARASVVRDLLIVDFVGFHNNFFVFI